MKTISGILLTALCLFCSLAFAQSVIVRETSSWRSIPITVDSTAKTYTVTGTVPTDTTNYYYTYSGYRCFSSKRDVAGVNFLVFNASVSGGSEIYCYPE